LVIEGQGEDHVDGQEHDSLHPVGFAVLTNQRQDTDGGNHRHQLQGSKGQIEGVRRADHQAGEDQDRGNEQSDLEAVAPRPMRPARGTIANPEAANTHGAGAWAARKTTAAGRAARSAIKGSIPKPRFDGGGAVSPGGVEVAMPKVVASGWVESSTKCLGFGAIPPVTRRILQARPASQQEGYLVLADHLHGPVREGEQQALSPLGTDQVGGHEPGDHLAGVGLVPIQWLARTGETIIPRDNAEVVAAVRQEHVNNALVGQGAAADLTGHQ
jgi:hypothetical protein